MISLKGFWIKEEMENGDVMAKSVDDNNGEWNEQECHDVS